MTFYVCFYDPQKQVLVEVEQADFPQDAIVMVSAHLSGLYRSGKSNVPAPIWVVFDLRDMMRIFDLSFDFETDKDTILDKHTLELIERRVKWFRKMQGGF